MAYVNIHENPSKIKIKECHIFSWFYSAEIKWQNEISKWVYKNKLIAGK